MNKTQINNIKARFLYNLSLLTNWQNKLKELVLRHKELNGDGGTSCLGQGIDIETEDYEVIVHFPYSMYLQGNVLEEIIEPLIQEIQSYCDLQFKDEKLRVIHQYGRMD